MSGHSRGPWSLVVSDKRWQQRYQVDDATGLCVVALEYSTLHDAEANAKLIAAAPKLLRACQLIAANAPVVANWLRANDPGAYAQVCAAIAEATGEAA